MGHDSQLYYCFLYEIVRHGEESGLVQSVNLGRPTLEVQGSSYLAEYAMVRFTSFD